MYTTSTAYKTEIQKRSRTFECRVTIGDRVFTNNEVQSIDLNGGIQDVFSIGNTPSMCLELVLRNTTDTIFTTNSVNVEIGLKIGNTIEYIPLGIFNIEDIKKDDYTTKFTCYDNMTKFEIAYFSSLGDKPTLQQVVNELASKTGVQFTGSLPSYTVKKLEGFTCREVLGYVASLCGGNALITRDGEFTIVYPTDISRDVGEGVFDLQRDEVKYKVGKITCQIKEQETISKGSLGTDSMELSFENPWVTETILTDIYNRLNGFNYLGYTMKWQGDLSLDIGDIITYTDAKKVTRKLPILYRKLSYDGGLDGELSAKGETKNKNSFNSSGSMSNKLNRVVTEVAIVNKAFIDYANINDANIKNLQVETAKIHNLEVETANINNILAGNIGSGSIQTIHLTGKNVVIDNAVIKSAMIDSLDLSKLNAGTISTNKFRITSDNGGIEIVGATQQFKDENNKVRIQMGQDTQGNFNFILCGADGTTTLIDHTGIKEKAIADDLIKSNMVAADAIGEKQINYSSLITGLNKDDNTSLIKASKVAIDLTGQSLEVAFSSLKSNIDNMEIGGVNLFVKKTATKNKYLNNSGVEVDEPNWFYTDYINVEGMKNIIASGYVNLGSAPSTCYYDSNKRFVKGINNKGQSLSKLITIDSGISYIRFSCDIRGFETLKLEQGTKSTVYSLSPEDIDQVTQSLQTQINANIKGIETLVKDTTIKQGDSTVKLQDFYSSFIQTNKELAFKVTQSEIDNSINAIEIGSTNLLRNTGIEKDTSYFSLATGVTRDTSVKCLGTNTFKYDISGLTTDRWSSANPTIVDVVEGEQYSASGYINIASAAINNTATFQLEIQWYDASGKRIVVNNVAVDGSIRNRWQLIKCEGKAAPVGAVKANCRIWVQRNGKCWVSRLKLEKGTKCSDWSPSPEDVENKIDAINIGSRNLLLESNRAINTSEYNTAVYQFGNEKLADGEEFVLQIKGQLPTEKTSWGVYNSGGTIKVVDIKESDKGIDGVYRIKGKWKTKTSTATASNKSLWIYAIPSSVTAISTIEWVKLERGNKDTDYTLAPEDMEQRVNSVEQKITATAITTTITEAINAGTNSFTTMQFALDKNGVTVKNGGIRILNNSNEEVLKQDIQGGIVLQGSIISKDSSGKKKYALDGQALKLYDWSVSTDRVAGAIESRKTDDTETVGMCIITRDNKFITIGYVRTALDDIASESSYPFMRFEEPNNNVYGHPIKVYKNIHLRGNELALSESANTGYSSYIKATGATIGVYSPSGGNYKMYELQDSRTGNVAQRITPTAHDVYADQFWCSGIIHAAGNMSCGGQKTRVVKTKSYGERLLTAYETADCLFADYGSGIINEDGECIIDIDDIFSETVDTNQVYRVFLTEFNEDDSLKNTILKVVKKEKRYFIVKGTPGLKFDWNIVLKQIDFNNDRLKNKFVNEAMSTKISPNQLINLDEFDKAKSNIEENEKEIIDLFKIKTSEDVLLEDILK